jgi:hypothetical protein
VSSAVDVTDADLIEFKGTRQKKQRKIVNYDRDRDSDKRLLQKPRKWMQCLCITSNDAGIYRKDDGDHGWVVY